MCQLETDASKKQTMIAPTVREGKDKQLGCSKFLKTEHCNPTNGMGNGRQPQERVREKDKKNRDIYAM